MKIFFTILCICMTCTRILAQEQLGIRLDNYSGINTTLLNPANSLHTPFRWDINLGELSFFAANNYAYLEKTNLMAILKLLPQPDVAVRFYVNEQTTIFPETIFADFFDDKKKRFATVSGSVLGPSFMLQLPNRQTVGLLTRFRVGASAQNVPTTLSHYTYYFRDFEDTFTILPFQGAVMAWSELGLHYAKGFNTYDGEATMGINIKYLQGYETAYFQNNGRIKYTKLPGDTITVSQSDVEVGLTTSNINGAPVNIQRNGTGIAFDVGFNMVISDFEDTYRWKIGAALLDIGRLRFNKNAEQHVMQRDSLLVIAAEDYYFAENITDLHPVIEVFSQQALGDPRATLVNNEFSIWLPGAFSLQADYAFNEYWHLNATIIQRFNFAAAALERGNLLALVPRYESRWLSAALPVVYYNGQNVRVGASLRLAFLTLGTDHLVSMLLPSKFSGSDFYLAVKINPFQLNANATTKGKRNKGKVKCYEF